MNVFELGILENIQDWFQCDFLDKFFPIITRLGDKGIFWIIVAVVLLFIKKYRKVGAMVGVALILGLIFGNGVLKNVIGRTRPYDMPEFYEIMGFYKEDLLVGALSDKSCPSGHTLASFEAATVLFINDKKLGIPALVIAVLVAFSRLYLCVHYPTDVLFGMVLGIAFGVLGCFIVNKTISIYNHKVVEKQF